MTVLAFYPLSGEEIPAPESVVQDVVVPPPAPMPLAPLSIEGPPPKIVVVPPKAVIEAPHEVMPLPEPVVVAAKNIQKVAVVSPLRIVQRPVAESLPNRTRAEIEQVFLSNKQAISEVYNLALRRDPNLKGMLVLKMTIEPSGAVTACEVVSSEFEDEVLLRELVERVRLFRFEGRKVAPITTVKPIDFYPA